MSIKDAPENDNLRAEPRLPHDEVIYVEIYTPCVIESDDLGPATRASETVDVSANGIQIRVLEPLREGAIIQICLLREKTGERFDLVAEVRWQKRLPGKSGYLTGLILLESDDTSIAEWKLTVSDMLSDENEDHVHC